MPGMGASEKGAARDPCADMDDRAYVRLGIAGAGRAGGVLGRALARAGYPVTAVWSRTALHAALLADAVGARALPSPAAVVAACDLVLLAVPDDAIVPLVATMLDSALWPGGGALVHLSGASGAALLDPAAVAGAATGALHPLQTFATPHADLPPGTAFALEASGLLRDRLLALVDALHGHALDIAPADRPLYHAAAALTANYAITLLAQAVAVLGRCGLAPEPALAALLPLAGGVLENLGQQGLPGALTGPIARGDVGTIRRHLAALDARVPDVATLYRALGSATIPLAAGLTPHQRQELQHVLSSGAVTRDGLACTPEGDSDAYHNC